MNGLDEEIENPLMRLTDEIKMKKKKCEERLDERISV